MSLTQVESLPDFGPVLSRGIIKFISDISHFDYEC